MPATQMIAAHRAGGIRFRLVAMTPEARDLWRDGKAWRVCCERLDRSGRLIWSDAGPWAVSPAAAAAALVAYLPRDRSAARKRAFAWSSEIRAGLNGPLALP